MDLGDAVDLRLLFEERAELVRDHLTS